MSKWFKYWSHILNIVLGVALIFAVVDNDDPPPSPSPPLNHTKQELEKASNVTAGMKAEAVQNVMGAPVKREFVGSREEWHYCRTGDVIDEYVAIRFEKGTVIELEHYSVSYLDTIFRNTLTPPRDLITVAGLGDCVATIRWGTYGQRVPQLSAAGTAQLALPAHAPRSAGSDLR